MTLVKDKVALVTGAGAGIGRATAKKFAEEGAKVVVSDIDPVGGNDTVDLVVASGGEAVFVKADVSNEAQITNLVESTIAKFGRLDCACNNAGIEGKVAPIADQDVASFDRVLSVNLRGVFLSLRAEIGAMLKTGGGAIVNLSSVAGLVGFPGLSPYVATKHGVNGLTKNAALEYAKQGIRVNSICPGGIDTRMLDSLVEQTSGGSMETSEMMAPLHPIGRIGNAEEVANLIVWLCSDRASFVTGAHVPIDGGYVAQ
jgi:NAD(P)-dependent dehydrogenase (short-subunit alcohol dehydrogenase family)